MNLENKTGGSLGLCRSHSALRKLNTEPPIGASHQVLVTWLNSYKEKDI